ncbi:MAG: serine hydrolase [Staphylococcus hominis]|nr:MAG: serine hydrolase [Staphylococcus hominis]
MRRENAWLAAGVGLLALSACVGASNPPPPPPAATSATVRMPVPPAVPRIATAPEPVVTGIRSLVADFDGLVGVAVRSVQDGWTASANGDRLMPQQSVSKLWVAMTVLDTIDRGRATLDSPVSITWDDLTLFHQPIAALVKRDRPYETTVRELLGRALTQSDNTANDRLLRFVGGPAAVRAFIERNALGSIRFGPGERLLQSRTAGLEWNQNYAYGRAFYQARSALPVTTRSDAYRRYIADPPDGASASAIAHALSQLKRGRLLSPGSTAYLISTMESSRTGKQRLRGAVPPGWRFGHKTGTGQDLQGRTAGYNDVGLLTAPDGKSYAIAVMIGDTGRPIPARQQLMQAVVATVVANHRR